MLATIDTLRRVGAFTLDPGRDTRPQRARRRDWLARTPRLRIIGGIDQLVARPAQLAVGHTRCTRVGLIGLALASLALLIVAASQFPAGHLHVIWPAVIVVVLVEITAHEYAHATVCRTLGVRIREAGIMLWRWFLPVPYVDCTDIYRLPGKRPRVLVALAGPYVDLVAAGACSAAALETTGAVSASAFVLVLAMAAALARNLMPVLPTDGYHALQAVTGELNLRGRSWSHLRDELDGIGLLGRRGHSSHSGTCAERRQRTKSPIVYTAYGVISVLYTITVFAASALIVLHWFNLN